jgi:hypothetical protein
MKARNIFQTVALGALIAVVAQGNMSIVFGQTTIGNAQKIAIGGPANGSWTGGTALYAITLRNNATEIWQYGTGTQWIQHWSNGLTGTPIAITVDPDGAPVVLTSNNKMYWCTGKDYRQPWVLAESNTQGGNEVLIGGFLAHPNPLWMSKVDGAWQANWLKNWQTNTWVTIWSGWPMHMHAADAKNHVWQISNNPDGNILSQDEAFNMYQSYNGFYFIPFNGFMGAHAVAASQYKYTLNTIYGQAYAVYASDNYGYVWQKTTSNNPVWQQVAQNPIGDIWSLNKSMAVDANGWPYVANDNGAVYSNINLAGWVKISNP